VTTIGVLYAGDVRDSATWSGIPAGLAGGLAAAGAQVETLDVRPPRRVRAALVRARVPQPEQCRVHTLVARRRIARAGRLDGLVQIGADFVVEAGVPLATYEDMTVVQHERHRDEWFLTHSARTRRAWLARQRIAYANASACCVMTRWAADSVVEDYGVPTGKVHVVGLGANHVVEPPPSRDWSQPRFLVIARDWRRKNVELVVHTFAQLRTERPTASLDVVGSYPGVGGAGVTVHGPLSLAVAAERGRVEELYRRATCYVMPSTHEAAGLVFVEAGHAGIASIGPTVGGATELIGEGGVAVDPDDGEQLLAAMRRLSDPETARALGSRAREHAASYTWPATARRLLRTLGLDADDLRDAAAR
jgi:glycosyltransferase involved in cell wall biosynthesis